MKHTLAVIAILCLLWISVANVSAHVSSNKTGVVIGDSIASGTNECSRLYPTYNLSASCAGGVLSAEFQYNLTHHVWYNHGWSGDNTTHFSQRFNRDALAMTYDVGDGVTAPTLTTKPNYTVVEIGINDMLHGSWSEDVFRTNMYSAAKNASDNHENIIFITMLPYQPKASDVIYENAWVITNLTNISSHVRVYDATALMGNASGGLKVEYDSGDGLHPTATGYIVLANAIYAANADWLDDPPASFSAWTQDGDSYVSHNDTYTHRMWNITGLHTFISSGNATSVNAVVVAGGGGGNNAGGGGGGVVARTGVSISGNINVAVGDGGIRTVGGDIGGKIGANSSFANTTVGNGLNALGGGGGGYVTSGTEKNGVNGGSGGGSGNAGTAGTGVSGQGFAGGGSASSSLYGTGGGGGNSSVGADGTTLVGGNGGTGYNATWIYGSYLRVAGGGGGYVDAPGTLGLGADGGGNANTFGNYAGNGTPGTGGGGGGGSIGFAGYGGSGVVIIEYLTPIPNASFTVNTTGGTAPLTVSITDTSMHYPTSWNYTATNVTGDNIQNSIGTTQNVVYTFTKAGNYSIALNASNSAGYNWSTQITFVNVSASTPIPGFTANKTEYSTYGYPVLFTDDIPSSHNSWNWTFGDNYTSTAQQPTHFYSVASRYTVTLNATNATGFDLVTKSNYINLTSDLDTNVKTWLHWNGTNGGTTFNGEVGVAWTPTAVTTSTSQVRFGYSSGLFAAANSRLSSAFSPTMNFTTGDFTIEQWVYPTSSGTNQFILSRTTNGGTKTDGWGIYHSTTSATSNAWVAYFGTTATQTGTFTLPLNSWSHLVVQRTSGNVIVYVNGTAVTTPLSATGNYDTVSSVIYGNPAGGGSTSSFQGYIDESRISSISRWATNFSSPTAQYAGDLYPIYPNPNPGAIMRFKTDPSIPSNAIIANLTPRNRTLQIQYVNITDNITASITFDPMHQHAQYVYPNASTWTGINFTYVSIDNVNGEVLLNATRPGGFSTNGATNNRASFVDVKMLYYNYTDPHDFDIGQDVQYFGIGILGNYTTGWEYPVSSFIATNVTFSDWKVFGNFTVNNTAPIVNEQPVLFIPELNFTANQFDWDFGDGTIILNSTNQQETHTYTTEGAKTVSLRAYLWQNGSVTNSTTLVGAVTPVLNSSFVQADFSGSPTSGSVGLNVLFTDLTTWGATNATSGRTYNWSFGDASSSLNPYSDTVGSTSHVYTNYGTYTVTLTVNNTLNSSTMSKSNYITIANSQLATTWYTQRLVTIKAVDKWGNPLPYSSMNATFLASSLPNTTTSWLVTAFGVTPAVAEQMVDNNLTLDSTTANDGSSTFMMFPGFNYQIWVHNSTSGVNHATTIQPNDVLYVIYCPTTGQDNTNTTQQQLLNTSLYITEPNISFVQFNFVYQDTSGLTESVYWNVTNWDNGTTMHANTYLLPGTGTIVDNYTVPNVRGQQWKFWYNASRSALS